MSFEQFFEEGVKSFQAKEYSKAIEQFQQALVLQPDNISALNNMALAHYELGQKTTAYVYFKKSTLIDPGNMQAQQGLEFTKSQIQLRDIPHKIELYEKAREFLVLPVSGHIPYALSWILFIALAYRWIRFLNRKRQAYFSGEDAPSFGVLNIVLTVCFVLTISWALFFSYDQNIPRALVKTESIALRSAPSVGSPSILELYGGLEVLVLRKQDDWAQVQYPGSFSGWVQKETLLEL